MVLFIFSSKLETRERVEKTQQILESKDPAQLATLTREDILGDLFYTGGLGYYAQLHTMDSMLSQQGQGIGLDLIGYGSYGYEPKLRQGLLAIPVGIEPGAVSTNVRGHNISQGKDSSNKNSREIADNTSFAMGMNGSVLESAISEQLFCNDTVNPNNKPCYGISTVSGLQRAAAQGQKIYQINSKNKDQLKNIVMSDQTMADDINTAINSGGYVIVPEKAVDGTGKDAIYVYMTYNSNGNQAWKIAGGLNGGTLADLSNDAYYGAFALDFFDSLASILDAKYKFAKKIADRLGGVFAILGVLVDLASAVTTIADVARNCKGGLKNPVVQSAMDSIVALTVVAIVMTAALGIASVLGGAVGGVIFAVLSNVFSAMYNQLVAHTAILAKETC